MQNISTPGGRCRLLNVSPLLEVCLGAKPSSFALHIEATQYARVKNNAPHLHVVEEKGFLVEHRGTKTR